MLNLSWKNICCVFLLCLAQWSCREVKSKVVDAKEQPNVVVDEACEAPLLTGLHQNKLRGVSLVAPPAPFQQNPMIALDTIGVNWVAVLPYAYYKKNQPKLHSFSGGWWGERPEGVKTTIRLAKEKGIRVMLKPQLWTHDQWIGNLDFETEEDWEQFEQDYTNFISQWATYAQEWGVEILCVGTEIKQSVSKRPDYWRKLIKELRTIFKGKLTYAANWDDYQEVTFWDELNYVGVDAYFPLCQHKTPSVCQLKKAWKETFETLKKYSEKQSREILFTEWGYLSVDACAHQTWVLEKKKGQYATNEQAQANATQALLEIFGQTDWWAGGFLWKWYPSSGSAMGEGSRAKDYTPQGKLAEEVLKAMYRS